MPYRLFLGVLLVVALLLTLNERYNEARAYQNAESLPSSLASSPIFQRDNRPPTAAAGTGASAAPRPAIPFQPHRVRVKRDVDLLRSPEHGALPVEPLSFVPAGIPAQAIEERNGWYLLDTNLVRGWAPIEAIEEP